MPQPIFHEPTFHEPIFNGQAAVLVIGGSDSAGMSGVIQDARTLEAMRVHPLIAITANSAQNSGKLLATGQVDAPTLQSQLDASLVYTPQFAKLGMVRGEQQIELIANYIEAHRLQLVYDPVLTTSSGGRLMDEQGLASPGLWRLLRSCLLVTPNLDEASQLVGFDLKTARDVERAASLLLGKGVKNLLVKGGHLDDQQRSQDYFCSQEQKFWLTSPRRAEQNIRGTGCALASAICASLALGHSLADSVVIGKMAINQAIRQAAQDPLGQLFARLMNFPHSQQDLPVLSQKAEVDFDQPPFADCGQTPLGLYPILDRASWLSRLGPLGVSTVQLRVKDLTGDELVREIAEAVALANYYRIRLFINDHWQLAIEQGAYGVHLGQSDLDHADLAAIRRAGLRLGVSSHCYYEVARAYGVKPSYIAYGPVYSTTTKDMPWQPQGLATLRYWQELLDYPCVAIGGISEERVEAVKQTGVSGIAMISAITQADNPQQTLDSILTKHFK